MATRKEVLFIAPFYNAFICGDLQTLQAVYPVKQSVRNWKVRALIPWRWLEQFFMIISRARKTQFIFIEFGGFWSLVPAYLGAILKIPVYIVLHGTDAASLPHYKYGSLRKQWIRKICGASYRKATCLLPVSESLIHTDNSYNEYDQLQGLKQFYPNLKTPIRVIPNGLDFSKWERDQDYVRNNYRFTAVFNDSQFLLKGGDLIEQLALEFPNCEFVVIGTDGPKNPEWRKGKVKYLGRLSQAELKAEFYQSSFHFQLSRFEGFGLSLCEAMLCGCVPIVSSVNILPEIVGNSGFVVEKAEVLSLKMQVKLALESLDLEKRRKEARFLIQDRYAADLRKQQLLKLLEEFS
ncbi:glycosyltransferase family 4 protein [Croceimicrobium hydrocarbonivorans]|uniref:Glycosyltransferase family 4 protein n=1 Tax=Croceimicrobium hydrocarbonivorans TaxID=2761580 RepID=A0A7H0VGC5_9FLAO|nr:glycosyltransferase family 4 protein [Croceimicrobium hydrocarbonivorans]QNR24773.1 glycosyltransferase family 4 protein [Croceimicrobium hydrocarbonivorans]